MNVEIGFPGGAVVEARYKGYALRTDQPRSHQGGGTAPSPFDLFVVSLASCAGYYVLRFLEQRGISTAGLALHCVPTFAIEGAGITAVRTEIELPAGFPEKYRAAVVRAAENCLVRRQLAQPIRFETSLRDAPPAIDAVA